MNPRIIVKDYSVHIVTGPGDQCECGIDNQGRSRNCHDIVQDMANRHISDYADGKSPDDPIDLGEDAVKSPMDSQEAPPPASSPV